MQMPGVYFKINETELVRLTWWWRVNIMVWIFVSISVDMFNNLFIDPEGLR